MFRVSKKSGYLNMKASIRSIILEMNVTLIITKWFCYNWMDIDQTIFRSCFLSSTLGYCDEQDSILVVSTDTCRRRIFWGARKLLTCCLNLRARQDMKIKKRCRKPGINTHQKWVLWAKLRRMCLLSKYLPFASWSQYYIEVLAPSL